jgi:hypothetical protein
MPHLSKRKSCSDTRDHFGVLIPPGPIGVLVATKPVDFRKGMDGAQLAALIEGLDWVRRETGRRWRVKVPYDEGVGAVRLVAILAGASPVNRGVQSLL